MDYNERMIKNNVPNLLREASLGPLSLVPAVSQGTAYAWANDRVTRYDVATLERLCEFFSARLMRPVGVGDVLIYERIQPPDALRVPDGGE